MKLDKNVAYALAESGFDFSNLITPGHLEQATNAAKDQILSVWSIDDVLARAKDDEVEISNDQAREILGSLQKNHDATVGINWDVISCHIDNYADSRIDA